MSLCGLRRTDLSGSSLPAEQLRRTASCSGVLLQGAGADEARFHRAAELIALKRLACDGLLDLAQVSQAGDEDI
ncbi:hypothetical protein CIW47_06190 [Mycolicibacterium sp. P1-5]|nr:hypothetical protein CIW47_06190 [Mycolicibacterium sp. P1-5]